MATAGSGSHPVVDFGISSVESLPCATMKLYNYVSKRKTASGFVNLLSVTLRSGKLPEHHAMRI